MRGHHGREKDGNPDGNAEFSEERKAIRADAEESNVPERKLPGVTADQVPGQSQRGKQRDAKEHLQLVVVPDQTTASAPTAAQRSGTTQNFQLFRRLMRAASQRCRWV